MSMFWDDVQAGLQERVMRWVRMSEETTCWQWVGATNQDGYGKVNFLARKYSAHRLIYMMHGHDIPAGYELDHLCRNVGCVNPAHMEAVTKQENLRRMRTYIQPKTHCINGHALTEDNIVTETGPRGTARRCRTCYLAQKREWAARQHA